LIRPPERGFTLRNLFPAAALTALALVLLMFLLRYVMGFWVSLTKNSPHVRVIARPTAPQGQGTETR
jgi:hypothetical protein